jgi:nicotinate-nucleotide adenylyltransferase
MTKRLGVFCGTFNPIHRGHLLMAELARQTLNLDRVFFVTSPAPPHRSVDLLNAEERFKLVSAAVATHPAYEASRIELDRSGPSYTVDTLKQLQRDNPDSQLYLIIGEDNLKYIASWKQADEIFQCAQLVVAPREKQTDKTLDSQIAKALPTSAKVIMLDLPHVKVSSSEIRKRLRAGESIASLVPPEVNEMLIQTKAYVT